MEQFNHLQKIESNHKQLLQLLHKIQEEDSTELFVPIIDGLAFCKGITSSKRITISLGENWFVELNVDDAIPLLHRRLKGLVY
jgi:prefoldin subunit 5